VSVLALGRACAIFVKRRLFFFEIISAATKQLCERIVLNGSHFMGTGCIFHACGAAATISRLSSSRCQRAQCDIRQCLPLAALVTIL
jgi:hypothetical protein